MPRLPVHLEEDNKAGPQWRVQEALGGGTWGDGEGQEGEEEDDDPYDDADGDYDMDNADEMNAEADMAGEAPSPNDDWTE